ncbi:hypothetical protein Fmac_028490 [Flemingia macrophylla]|uniref:Uncharacterized protein n=1 Tax=Flemingia macrophylla TaxID=520843 RepID=A0ABD1L7Q0_9FABA
MATDTSTETRKLEGKLDALVNLVTQLAANQKPAFIAIFYGIPSSNDHHTSFSARNDAIVIRRVHDVPTDTSAETRKLEGELDALVNLVTQLAANHKSASVARQFGRDEYPEAYAAKTYSTPPQQQRQDTSAETRKLEGKLDALVNLVTQLAANQKAASVARVCDIRSSSDHHSSVCHSLQQSGVDERPEAYAANTYIGPPQHQRVHDVATYTSAETRNLEVCGILSPNDHHTRVCPSSQQSGVDEHPEAYGANTYSRPPEQGVPDVATDTSTETKKLEGKLDALVNLVTQLATNQKPASVANGNHTSVYSSSQQSGFSVRNDVIVIRGVHDVATDTSAETRKLEGKIDALQNLVTQLAANQNPTSVARVYDIHSSNDHYTKFSARNDAIVIREVHNVAKDTSAETRKFEGKPDALVNLVTQLAANQKPISVARIYAFVRSMTTILVDPTKKRDKVLDREDGSQLLALSGVDQHSEAYAANTYSRPSQQGVHDVAIDTSAETRKLEGKLDALMNLVTQLAANQKSASVATDHDSSRDKALDREDGYQLLAQSGVDEHSEAYAANTYSRPPQQGVHYVAIDTSAETRKLAGKLDALVNLVTQLAVNQKSASVARVCGIRSSNDHHASVCPSSQQSGVDEHPEAYAAKTYSRPPQQQRQDTSAETRKLEVYVLLHTNLEWMSILRLMMQTPIADRDSRRDKALDREDGYQLLAFRARNDAMVIRGVNDVATDISAETRKLEGKLDALVNLMTQLVSNQKPASVVRVCRILSSNDHHTSVCHSLQQSGVDEKPEAYAANTYSRPPQQQRQGT